MVCGYLKIETFGKTTNQHVDITSSVIIGQGGGAQDRKVGNARQWSARPFVCLRGQLKNQSQATIEGRISLYDSIIEMRFPLYPFQTHRDHKILQRHNIFLASVEFQVLHPPAMDRSCSYVVGVVILAVPLPVFFVCILPAQP